MHKIGATEIKSIGSIPKLKKRKQSKAHIKIVGNRSALYQTTLDIVKEIRNDDNQGIRTDAMNEVALRIGSSSIQNIL